MNGFVYPYKYNILNKPPCGRLYGPFGTGRGRRPRSLKQPLDKVFFKNIIHIIFFQLFNNILLTAYNFFSTFQNYLVNGFFKGPGEKSFFKGSLQEYLFNCFF